MVKDIVIPEEVMEGIGRSVMIEKLEDLVQQLAEGLITNEEFLQQVTVTLAN